eukprot:TRINITY_DN93827_c0_g1_i1.p1 TRINITY_DN93827_c0_g1~~TRINITY_DN93827_c0_g1_i1.p1  ORF type:complete len:590 (+),score=118.84 TRINITY_DN93827_c0_g1_i1:90-1859(+)
MKAYLVALTCLLCTHGTHATKIFTGTRGVIQTGMKFECPDNRFPMDPAKLYSAFGKSKYFEMFPNADLKTALANDKDWKVRQRWNLTVVANSDRFKTTKFAFAGDVGFMPVEVPKGTVDKVISSVDQVRSSGEMASFQYLGDDVVTDHDVTLTSICLTPVKCDSWLRKGNKCKGHYKEKKDPELVIGFSQYECCEEAFCAVEEPCWPETQWGKGKDYATKKGWTTDSCCYPKPCPDSVCGNSTKFHNRPGTGKLGSTLAECCEPRYCLEYQCREQDGGRPPITKEYKNLLGSTADECCVGWSCADFSCNMSKAWKDKANKSALKGKTYAQCCEPVYCKEFDQDQMCTPASKYPKVLNLTFPDGSDRAGHSAAQCCEVAQCKDHNCSKGWEYKLGYKEYIGSTDDECCRELRCADFKCGPSSKWIHKANVVEGKDLKGYSHEDCCEPIMCSDYTCWPSELVKVENATMLQGSTNEECCTSGFCEDYNCTGDWNLTGESTKFIKKKDTNHYKYRGSSDQACCIPKYCSQYTTSYPTKWIRKTDATLLGSTDFECYDPRWCKDYTCKSKRKKPKPCGWNITGASDEECCDDI